MRLPMSLLSAMAVLVGGLTSAANAQTYDLKHKFSAGQELQYASSNQVEQTQQIGGMEIKTEIESQDLAVRRLVKQTETGELDLEVENKKLDVKMKIATLGEYSFSSSRSDNDKGSTLGAALTPLYETVSGAIVRIRMTPRGKLSRVQGLEELLKSVLEGNPLAQQFAAGATEDGAKLMYGELFVEFPDRPLQAGDRWEIPYVVTLPKLGEAKGTRKYRLVGPSEVRGRRTVKIEVTTELSFDLNIKADQATVSGTLAANDSTGTIHFDPERGQVVQLENTLNISGNLTVDVNGMQIPLTQKQSQKVRSELVLPDRSR